MSKHGIVLLSAVGFLSACGGGGAMDAVSEAKYLVNTLENRNITKIRAVDLPPKATMKGIVGADVLRDNQAAPDAVLLGTTEFVADFANGSLSGTASDFAIYERVETEETIDPGNKTADLGGTLAVTGTIRGVEFDYTADGRLSVPATKGDPASAKTTLISSTAGFANAEGVLVGAGEVSGTFVPGPRSAVKGGTLQDGAIIVMER